MTADEQMSVITHNERTPALTLHHVLMYEHIFCFSVNQTSKTSQLKLSVIKKIRKISILFLLM